MEPVAELVAKAVVCLAVMLPFIIASIIILREKDRAAEINVIWYAFSLVFVLWCCLHLAINLDIVRLPSNAQSVLSLRDTVAKLESRLEGLLRNKGINAFNDTANATDELKRAEEELRRRVQEGELYSARYFYTEIRSYLTNGHHELALVATILIVTIAPQLLNYILSGFAGCATTPRLVWQFEKIAIWSLIKFLAAFGGLSVAGALGVYANGKNYLYDEASGQNFYLYGYGGYVDDLLWGVGAVTLAFVVAVCQVYTLEAAHALGEKRQSWPYVVHRFFTRNLPLAEDKPGEDAEPEAFAPRQIWEKLTPLQRQEIGPLMVGSLLNGGDAAKKIFGKLTPAQQQEVISLLVQSLSGGQPAAKTPSSQP
jgi:hypothetical protein